MVAHDNLGPQFHQYKRTTYRIEPDPTWPRMLNAVHHNSGKTVGFLSWNNDAEHNPEHVKNTVHRVQVLKKHQRRGIASALLEHARQINPELQHSHARTPEGQAWSAARP